MTELVEHLQKTGVLRSPSVIEALRAVDRADFVPTELQHLAYEDAPLPIGYGQTISQPYTVVFMLEELAIREGDRVFEVGYGSGWQTALLAHIVGESGSVHGFELLPMLCAMGKTNLQKYPQLAGRVTLLCMSAEQGSPEDAPFDRIICAAEVPDVPVAWREQLREGGQMIYPYQQNLISERKLPNGSFETKKFPGFVFVPFIRNDNV